MKPQVFKTRRDVERYFSGDTIDLSSIMGPESETGCPALAATAIWKWEVCAEPLVYGIFAGFI
jgi:hypothetical protein